MSVCVPSFPIVLLLDCGSLVPGVLYWCSVPAIVLPDRCVRSQLGSLPLSVVNVICDGVPHLGTGGLTVDRCSCCRDIGSGRISPLRIFLTRSYPPCVTAMLMCTCYFQSSKQSAFFAIELNDYFIDGRGPDSLMLLFVGCL